MLLKKNGRSRFLRKLINNVFPLLALHSLRYLNDDGAGFVCLAQNSDVSRLKINPFL